MALSHPQTTDHTTRVDFWYAPSFFSASNTGSNQTGSACRVAACGCHLRGGACGTPGVRAARKGRGLLDDVCACGLRWTDNRPPHSMWATYRASLSKAGPARDTAHLIHICVDIHPGSGGDVALVDGVVGGQGRPLLHTSRRQRTADHQATGLRGAQSTEETSIVETAATLTDTQRVCRAETRVYLSQPRARDLGLGWLFGE